MSEDPEIVALVPMRHHSARVPGKNYRNFVDRPLYAHILGQLLRCPEIREIVINTDSTVIREGVKEHFPQVRLIERPDYLTGGEVPMNDVLLYDIDQVPAEYYLQTHSTNPLLRSSTISQAIRTFLDGFPQYDSLFSVTRLQSRLWHVEGSPINHDPEVLLRTQDLPHVFEENSCLYIFQRDVFQSRRNRLGEQPLMYEIEAGEAWDIDEELDFAIAEFLMRQRGQADAKENG
jgi:CMP-N-acetylneuraminic acid synthetase